MRNLVLVLCTQKASSSSDHINILRFQVPSPTSLYSHSHSLLLLVTTTACIREFFWLCHVLLRKCSMHSSFQVALLLFPCSRLFSQLACMKNKDDREAQSKKVCDFIPFHLAFQLPVQFVCCSCVQRKKKTLLLLWRGTHFLQDPIFPILLVNPHCRKLRLVLRQY